MGTGGLPPPGTPQPLGLSGAGVPGWVRLPQAPVSVTEGPLVSVISPLLFADHQPPMFLEFYSFFSSLFFLQKTQKLLKCLMINSWESVFLSLCQADKGLSPPWVWL